MSDIVDRLRDHYRIPTDLELEAADEIERLRAALRYGSCVTRITETGVDVGHCTLKPEVERLRAALFEIRANILVASVCRAHLDPIDDIARRALSEKR